MAKKLVGNVIMVPFQRIFVPSAQIRSDAPEIAKLAESIREKGLLYPVLVAAGGPDGYDYTLVEGFRRCQAWLSLGWHGREIPVSVREKGDPLSRIADNWIANMEREGFHPLDQAECIHNLLEGSYPVLDGEEPTPVSREDVSKRLGMSLNQVGRLAKMHRAIDPDVARLARKAEAPLYLLMEISRVEGEGETPAEREEDRAQRQEKLLTAWTQKQERLEGAGRKRAERSDKGKAKKGKVSEEEPSGALKPSKRVDHAVYADEAERAYSVADYVRVIKAKQAALAEERSKEAREAAVRMRGVLDGIRFVLGEIKKLPDLNKSDFDVLKATTEAAEESEAAE